MTPHYCKLAEEHLDHKCDGDFLFYLPPSFSDYARLEPREEMGSEKAGRGRRRGSSGIATGQAQQTFVSSHVAMRPSETQSPAKATNPSPRHTRISTSADIRADSTGHDGAPGISGLEVKEWLEKVGKRYGEMYAGILCTQGFDSLEEFYDLENAEQLEEFGVKKWHAKKIFKAIKSTV